MFICRCLIVLFCASGAGASTSRPAKSAASGLPVILQQPISQYVAQYDTAIFTTRLAGEPFTEMTWHNATRTERPHPIPETIGLDVHSPNLLIPGCLDNDSYNGTYWLSVANAAGAVTTRRARLTVVPAPRITGGSPNRTVRLGSSLSLTINSAPDRAPWKKYEWRKDGAPLRMTRVLHLKHLQLSDSGDYECVISTIGGSVSATVTVLVLPY